jgi:pantetheine-phosphate adenylyltransferase
MGDTVRVAVCPGSFDPLTNGHVEMIARAARLFDRLIVAVLDNPSKQSWFTVDERTAMLREVLGALPDGRLIEVDAFSGLLVDYATRRQAVAVIRGLRTVSEFSEESQMALMNRHLSGCETVFLVSGPAVAYISSRLVKEVAALGGPLDGLVPPAVAARMTGRRNHRPVSA